MDNKRVESWGNCAASFAHFVAQVSLELSLKLVLKQMHVQRLEVLNGFQSDLQCEDCLEDPSAFPSFTAEFFFTEFFTGSSYPTFLS
ncbi:hypothetical protein Y032_0250g164 [Ancylostoma ceylanicum]|uniref:Uncharacterized protein n=1 Tax=Ancylostoma ceylanicum TaxID=53326 RepID=A0A016SCB6_9BILA|nr:hypothetical protein Y032_0250g164 [Ancylostoma ceylanicum]